MPTPLWETVRDLIETYQYSEAEDAIRACLDADPDNGEAWCARAVLKLWQREVSEAEAAVAKAAALLPDSSWPSRLQCALSLTGQPGKDKTAMERALVAAHKALEVRPDYVPSLAMLAFVHCQSGQVEEAQRLVERIPLEFNAYPEIARARAYVAHAAADDEKAEVHARTSLTKNPLQADLYALLAEIYRERDAEKDAVLSAALAAALQPDSAWYKHVLSSVTDWYLGPNYGYRLWLVLTAAVWFGVAHYPSSVVAGCMIGIPGMLAPFLPSFAYTKRARLDALPPFARGVLWDRDVIDPDPFTIRLGFLLFAFNVIVTLVTVVGSFIPHPPVPNSRDFGLPPTPAMIALVLYMAYGLLHIFFVLPRARNYEERCKLELDDWLAWPDSIDDALIRAETRTPLPLAYLPDEPALLLPSPSP